MSIPFSVADPKHAATTDVVVELSPSRVPPMLPFELRDYVSPNTWEIRVSTLARLASHYSRPTFERVYLAVIIVLTFLAPIATYYASLQALEDTTDDLDRLVWLARVIAFAVTIVTWVVLSAPVVVWRYLGKVHIVRLADQWTRSDALSAQTYGDAPVWKAGLPGFFKDTVVLMVTVPVTRKSYFDRDSYLPPYIVAGDDALPPYYGDTRVTNWSKDLNGGVKYGDLPIYTDKNDIVRV